VPTYQYACTACGHELEAVQSFADDPLTECPTCAGRLRKVFASVGIVFKGSGFYRTDSRSDSTKTKSEAAGASSGTETKSSTDSKSESTGTKETKPAKESGGSTSKAAATTGS
jgi:putative FmdB family regulatory protein